MRVFLDILSIDTIRITSFDITKSIHLIYEIFTCEHGAYSNRVRMFNTRKELTLTKEKGKSSSDKNHLDYLYFLSDIRRIVWAIQNIFHRYMDYNIRQNHSFKLEGELLYAYRKLRKLEIFAIVPPPNITTKVTFSDDIFTKIREELENGHLKNSDNVKNIFLKNKDQPLLQKKYFQKNRPLSYSKEKIVYFLMQILLGDVAYSRNTCLDTAIKETSLLNPFSIYNEGEDGKEIGPQSTSNYAIIYDVFKKEFSLENKKGDITLEHLEPQASLKIIFKDIIRIILAVELTSLETPVWGDFEFETFNYAKLIELLNETKNLSCIKTERKKDSKSCQSPLFYITHPEGQEKVWPLIDVTIAETIVSESDNHQKPILWLPHFDGSNDRLDVSLDFPFLCIGDSTALKYMGKKTAAQEKSLQNLELEIKKWIKLNQFCKILPFSAKSAISDFLKKVNNEKETEHVPPIFNFEIGKTKTREELFDSLSKKVSMIENLEKNLTKSKFLIKENADKLLELKKPLIEDLEIFHECLMRKIKHILDNNHIEISNISDFLKKEFCEFLDEEVTQNITSLYKSFASNKVAALPIECKYSDIKDDIDIHQKILSGLELIPINKLKNNKDKFNEFNTKLDRLHTRFYSIRKKEEIEP